MTSAITATGLRKSFGGKIVLDGIDLEVGAGTTFSLLGPNGAGKTTTVQIMSTLVHADGGEVRVAGRVAGRDPAAVRATIGVTGQFSAVDNLLTGEENLLRSAPGRSGPPPCSGPIAISVLSYPAAGNGPSSASPAGCASRTARFPHTASPACGDASPTHDGGTTMPDFRTRTPGPISVTLELGTGDVRIAASDRTDTVVEVRPSNEADESDVKAAQQVRVDYAGGMLRVTGPKPGAFDFSRKTSSVDVSIELPSDSQVSLDTLAGDVRCAGRLGECRLKTSAGSFWLEQTGPLRLKTGIAATGLRRLASAIERAGGEDTGSEGASR